MQFIDLLTNAIALFSAVYFLTAFAAHLHHCWVNPPAKHTAVAPTLLDLPLLLPPAPPAAFSEFSESHPWELAIDRMPTIEPIELVAVVAVETECSSELSPVEVAMEVEPDAPIDLSTEPAVQQPECPAGEAIDLSSLSSTALRSICTQRGIRWRGVKAGKHLSKPEMLAALTA